jgi:hypothetical protein
MSFNSINTWNSGDPLDRNDLNQLDAYISSGIDKRLGRKDTISSNLELIYGDSVILGDFIIEDPSKVDINGSFAINNILTGNPPGLKLGYKEFDLSGVFLYVFSAEEMQYTTLKVKTNQDVAMLFLDGYNFMKILSNDYYSTGDLYVSVFSSSTEIILKPGEKSLFFVDFNLGIHELNRSSAYGIIDKKIYWNNNYDSDLVKLDLTNTNYYQGATFFANKWIIPDAYYQYAVYDINNCYTQYQGNIIKTYNIATERDRYPIFRANAFDTFEITLNCEIRYLDNAYWVDPMSFVVCPFVEFGTLNNMAFYNSIKQILFSGSIFTDSFSQNTIKIYWQAPATADYWFKLLVFSPSGYQDVILYYEPFHLSIIQHKI